MNRGPRPEKVQDLFSRLDVAVELDHLSPPANRHKFHVSFLNIKFVAVGTRKSRRANSKVTPY